MSIAADTTNGIRLTASMPPRSDWRTNASPHPRPLPPIVPTSRLCRPRERDRPVTRASAFYRSAQSRPGDKGRRPSVPSCKGTGIRRTPSAPTATRRSNRLSVRKPARGVIGRDTPPGTGHWNRITGRGGEIRQHDLEIVPTYCALIPLPNRGSNDQVGAIRRSAQSAGRMWVILPALLPRLRRRGCVGSATWVPA
jgi:hypothetical protein